MNTTYGGSVLTLDALRDIMKAFPPRPTIYASPYLPRGSGYRIGNPNGHVTFLVNDEDAKEHNWPIDNPPEPYRSLW